VVKMLGVELRGRVELILYHHPGIVGAIALAHVLDAWRSRRWRSGRRAIGLEKTLFRTSLWSGNAGWVQIWVDEVLV
jgi:hypothetical protein